MDRIDRQRQKYDSSKSHSDFLREYTFGDDNEDEDTENQKEPTILDKIMNLFRK